MVLKRKSVSLTDTQARDALSCLPLESLKRTGEFVYYTKTNMKLAPSWSAGGIYMGAINKLLEASQGKRVNQKSFYNIAKAWVLDEDIGICDAKVEIGIYRLRALMNQIANHKATHRKVPPKYEKKYSYAWGKSEGVLMDIEAAPHEEELKEAEEYVVNIHTPLYISDSDEDFINSDTLFSSADEKLNKILQTSLAESPKKYKLTQKTSADNLGASSKEVDNAVCPNVQKADVSTIPNMIPLADLRTLGSEVGNVSKKIWGEFQKRLKGTKERVKPNRRKAKAKAKATEGKPNKFELDEGRLPYAVWRKRTHSIAYHRAFKAAKDSGMEKPDCLKLARKAGVDKYTDIDKMKADGELPDHVVV
jgi:hypothetical protein